MASRRERFWWADLPETELLGVRLNRLGLRIGDTPLEERLERVGAELERAGLRFRPYAWLSTGWWTPHGVTGFAIPFWLAHPRLRELERRTMGEAEGGREELCLRLMRHETGHAIDNAYRLHRRKSWRQTFGPFGTPYRATYRTDARRRRRFVVNLEHGYAQSHPVEDFAETFAVWLRPGARWRRTYAGTPALAKLEYVDALMREIGPRPPPLRTRERTESLSRLRMTLREYYRRRISRLHHLQLGSRGNEHSR